MKKKQFRKHKNTNKSFVLLAYSKKEASLYDSMNESA